MRFTYRLNESGDFLIGTLNAAAPGSRRVLTAPAVILPQTAGFFLSVASELSF
jgi:hypothetical protein